MDTILDIIKDLANRLEILERSRASDEAFTDASYLNSWVDYGVTHNKAGYYKALDGRVHLQGVVKSGTIGQPIFTLPTGYRPSKTLLFTVPSNGAFGVVEIQTDGDVVATTGNNTYVSLEGINFRV